MLQNIMGQTDYYFSVCTATNGVHAELQWGENEKGGKKVSVLVASFHFITVTHFTLDV
jgi:hypothetical protein